MKKIYSYKFLIYYGILVYLNFACKAQNPTTVAYNPSKAEVKPISNPITKTPTMQIGASQLSEYLPLLQNKKVGLVVNHTALVGKSHLVDTLLSLGIKIEKVFAPEHGFRGKADAGEYLSNSVDEKTGIPIISLYGKNKKPTNEQLAGLDLLVFDIQDVGVRFYTYISTLHYMMEACAESQKKLIVLDCPNPNGSYIDGPIREYKYKSFVGMHPIPIVYGLTVGELALMINGEKWLKYSLQCDLQVIKNQHYTHEIPYSLPVRPSPNLPNDAAIQLYPSLCLFEGTMVSVGRGTESAFQIIGAPQKNLGEFTFTPHSIEGMAKNPMYKDQTCYGLDLREAHLKGKITLKYLIEFYKKAENPDKFFNKYFDTLAGTAKLREQIEAGMSEKAIRASWENDLAIYKEKRKKYLLYP